MALPSTALGSPTGLIKLLIGIALTALLYAYFIHGLSYNPPGFYLDESAGSYNAYLIGTTGASEFGDLPLYPKYYTGSRAEQGNPTHLYMLAAMYVFIPPSVVSARIMAASTVFVACLLLGLLAWKLSDRLSVGVIVALTAMFTPWLFDASRLVLEVFTYPLSVVLLLLSIHSASKRDRWAVKDHVFIAGSLALVTYSYSIGRLLGPALAFGLIVFAVNRERIYSVCKTWIAFAITLIPLVIFTLTKPGAISKRFVSVTYLSWDKPILENISGFLSAYFADISPTFLLYEGDPLARHHLPVMGELLAATAILALVGLLIIVFRHWKDAWWQFVVYGLAVSVLPGAMTLQRYHSLRLSAFPVFLLVLTVPAQTWLIGKRTEASERPSSSNVLARLGTGRSFGFSVLICILALSAYQAYIYQSAFADAGPNRGHAFDEAYLPLLERALAEPSRPIYLEDGFWGPAYVHAYWYGTIKGVSLNNFSHLPENQKAPVGGLVLSSNQECTSCQIVERNAGYLLYRVIDQNTVIQPVSLPVASVEQPTPRPDASSVIQLDADRPRGIAVTVDGSIYVTDQGNSRVLKLSPSGAATTFIRTSETAVKEPSGIDVDTAGNIYVVDTAIRTLSRFNSSGKLDKQWPSLGLEAPVDVEIKDDRYVYISDAGRSRIVRLDVETGVASDWGTPGTSDSQFNDLKGLASSDTNLYAADAQNNRVQMFDLEGVFVGQWQVPQWDKYIWHRPDIAVDGENRRVFVTNGWKNEVLVFDNNGEFVRSLVPAQPAGFNNVSAAVVARTKQGRFLYVLNTGSDVLQTGKPYILVFELPVP